MIAEPAKPRRSWRSKFADAFRGVRLGIVGQSSFVVHAVCAMAVVLAVAVLPGITSIDWCLLLLCMALVIAAELFNSALERLVAAVHPGHHPGVGTALDIASGAVLVCAIGAAIVGAVILGPPLVDWFMAIVITA